MSCSLVLNFIARKNTLQKIWVLLYYNYLNFSEALLCNILKRYVTYFLKYKFFKLVERKFHFPKYKKLFTFRALKVFSWNIRTFKVSIFWNMRKFFQGFRFLNHKKFSRSGCFFFSSLGWVYSAGFDFWKFKKGFYLSKHKKSYVSRKCIFFNIRARKFHFRKYKELFSQWILFFFFFFFFFWGRWLGCVRWP